MSARQRPVLLGEGIERLPEEPLPNPRPPIPDPHLHRAAYSRHLAAQLETQLASGAKGVSRHSTATRSWPKHLPTRRLYMSFLDIDPTAFQQRYGDRRVPLKLDNTAVEVVDGALSIVANYQRHEATVSWNAMKERYDLESPTLRSEFFVEIDPTGRELVSFINEEQALRVVPATPRALYSHGHFFQPVLPLRRAGAFQLLDVLHPVVELPKTALEKGEAFVNDDWQPDSVFGLISALDPVSGLQAPEAMKTLLNRPDLLLCTDLGTEVADFVATQGTRVVFMHAKASKELRHYSASVLHGVASQAIKNLPYLQPLSETKPPTNQWTRPWKFPGTSEGTRRLRVGDFASAAEMWAHIRRVISNPNAEREVWLVLGQALSIQALKEQARKVPPAAEAMQVFSLLQTTWGAVSRLGARLRILCHPEPGFSAAHRRQMASTALATATTVRTSRTEADWRSRPPAVSSARRVPADCREAPRRNQSANRVDWPDLRGAACIHLGGTARHLH